MHRGRNLAFTDGFTIRLALLHLPSIHRSRQPAGLLLTDEVPPRRRPRRRVRQLLGRKRFLLASPRQYPHFYFYPLMHPSGRHSALDWPHSVGLYTAVSLRHCLR